MKTIAIEDITDTYEEDRILYNQETIKRYGSSLWNDPSASFYLNLYTYKKLISVMIESDDEIIREIRFGITSKGSDTIVIPNADTIPLHEKLKMYNMVEKF